MPFPHQMEMAWEEQVNPSLIFLCVDETYVNEVSCAILQLFHTIHICILGRQCACLPCEFEEYELIGKLFHILDRVLDLLHEPASCLVFLRLEIAIVLCNKGNEHIRNNTK